jgi:hypothetical protein
VKFTLACKNNPNARLINPRIIQKTIDGLKEGKRVSVQVKFTRENDNKPVFSVHFCRGHFSVKAIVNAGYACTGRRVPGLKPIAQPGGRRRYRVGVPNDIALDKPAHRPSPGTRSLTIRDPNIRYRIPKVEDDRELELAGSENGRAEWRNRWSGNDHYAGRVTRGQEPEPAPGTY